MRLNNREKAPSALSKNKQTNKNRSAFIKAQIVGGAKVKRKSGGRLLRWALCTYSLFTNVTVTDEEPQRCYIT